MMNVNTTGKATNGIPRDILVLAGPGTGTGAAVLGLTSSDTGDPKIESSGVTFSSVATIGISNGNAISLPIEMGPNRYLSGHLRGRGNTRGALEGRTCPKYNSRAGNPTLVPCTNSSRQATLFSVAVSVCRPRVRAL
jgi:hypothetical protein